MLASSLPPTAILAPCLPNSTRFVLHLRLPGVTVRCRERTQDVASVRASGMQPLVLVEVQSVLGDEMDPLNLVDGRESTSSCQNVGYFLQT